MAQRTVKQGQTHRAAVDDTCQPREGTSEGGVSDTRTDELPDTPQVERPRTLRILGDTHDPPRSVSGLSLELVVWVVAEDRRDRPADHDRYPLDRVAEERERSLAGEDRKKGLAEATKNKEEQPKSDEAARKPQAASTGGT